MEPLCELRAQLASDYGLVLAHASQLQRDAKDELQARSIEILMNRLRNDALWASSEVSRSTDCKILRQRYISQDVYDHWENLKKRGIWQKKLFLKDCDGKTLIHEHVTQRKWAKLALQSLTDASKISEQLCEIIACVVTKGEHMRLKPQQASDGWKRYEAAQPSVGVYDRLQQRWQVKRSC